MIGALTFESAAYVARYIMKKATGPLSELFYTIEDEESGELVKVKPEYVTMSRRPGIGKDWFEKYKRDVFPDDFVLIKRKDKYVPCKPPKFYVGQFEISDPLAHAKLKARREVAAEEKADDNTHERMLVKERITKLRIKELRRKYENED